MLYSVPVHLIRQWCYCPRVVYYSELTNVAFYRPAWVKQGKDFHQLEQKLWKRRNLSRFNLDKGKVYHNLKMQDDDFGMHGVVDMAIETDEKVYAVEFKLSAHNKNRGDQLQLIAYSMLLEKHFSKPSSVGFLAGQGKILYTVKINLENRKKVTEIKNKIIHLIESGVKPDTSATVNQCCNCDYLNFCNDRF